MTSGKSTEQGDLRYKIQKRTSTSTEASGSISVTHTNSALAKGRDKEAEDRRKAQRYNNRSETSGSKGNYRSSTYTSSTYKHDTNRSRNDNRGCEHITPPAFMLKIVRGEGISCDSCRAWCTRRDSYVCLHCRLDNVKQAKAKLKMYAKSTSGDKRPGINYEEFNK